MYLDKEKKILKIKLSRNFLLHFHVFGPNTDPTSVAKFCPYRSGFISSLLNMGFVVNKVELGVDFLRIPLFTLTVSFHQYT